MAGGSFVLKTYRLMIERPLCTSKEGNSVGQTNVSRAQNRDSYVDLNKYGGSYIDLQ